MRERFDALRTWVARIGPRARRRALGGGLLVVVLVVVGLSIEAQSTTTYDLRDSGVWVTNDDQVGRLNAQIPEIDYAADSESTELAQDGRHAYIVTTGDGGAVAQLDPADPGAEPSTVEVPGLDAAAVGGGVVAALASGELRIIGRDGVLTGVLGDPVAEVADDAVVAAGPTGTVVALSPSTGRVVTVSRGGGVERSGIDPLGGAVQLTVVGDRAVVLDQDAARLVLPDGDVVDLTGRGDRPAVQRPGPGRGVVVVATSTSLLEVDLDDGSIDEIDDEGDGQAVRPAWDGSCTYGAWLGSVGEGRVVARCDGEDPITAATGGGSSWRFRTGGPTVVLNDPSSGAVFVKVDDRLVKVTDWPTDEVPQTDEPEVEEEPPNPRGDTPPVAVADVGDERMGARPGRTTFLQVLRNDWDPDGDLVFVSRVVTPDARVAVAQGGRSISLDLTGAPPDEAGTIRFRYQISDGENLSEVVAVEVEIVTGEGRGPQLISGQKLSTSVEAGRRIDYEVLSAFWDPDGDPIFLAALTPPGGGHQIAWEADGWISFSASNRTGDALVRFTVKDITNASVADALTVDVEAPGPTSLPPVARNDFVTATVGTPITVDPLANDVDPNGDPLTLVDVELLRGAAADLGPLDRTSSSFSVLPRQVGDFVLLYTVSDGTAQPQTAQATVVLRVLERPSDDVDPIALDDVVLVEVGRSGEVDLTRNDVDPLGRLLSVTAIRVVGEAPDTLTFGLANDFRTFQVDTLPGAEPDTFLTVEYDVSSGPGRATSTVTVVVVPAPSNRPPQPVVPPPVVAVRAGEVATVPLEAFAWDPDGDPLTVHVSGPVAVGDARPSGTAIRYFAPASAGGRRVTVPIEVREPTGTTQATSVVMDVIRPSGNSRPEALDLEARVRRGGEVVIPIPLLDRDPDGDPVRLVGRVGSSAIRGEVVEDHGHQAFVYRATDRAFTGQDTFSYRVVDSLGAESQAATVTVSVTDAGGNSPPVAVTDRAITRVDGEVWVDAVANDTDIDGDAVELASTGVEVLAGGCEAEAREGRVRVIAGEVAEECTISYAVVDVDPDIPGAPNHAPVLGRIIVRVLDLFEGTRPIARDDYAALEGDVESVRVDVLANDEDPDGLTSDLRLELVDPPAGARFDQTAAEVVIPVTPEPQLVRYRITDADDLSADAVVRVPGGAENRPPALVSPAPPTPSLQADGDPLAIDLTDHVFDPDGDALTFSDISSASAVATTLRSRLAEGIAVFDPLSDDLSGLVTFQVTATDDAPEPLSRVFTITVRIERRDNRAPDWKGSPCRPVEKGAPATVIRLGAYVEDPDLDPLTFSGGGSQGGVTVRVTEAGELSLAASTDATTGSRQRFRLAVDDGRAGGEVETSCVVEVLPTARPAIQAANATATARQGETVRVDVRPLVRGAEGGISIERVGVETGSGRAVASGTVVSYTAPADFAGDAVIRYEVADDLDDAESPRRATAVITVSVSGRPSPPEAVAAVSEASRSVTVGWRNGAFNGSPVTRFLIRSIDGSVSTTCVASPCTLGATEGIVNGRTYRFTVVAVNGVGESDPSAPSNEVVPNTTPGAPVELTATALPGDSTRTGRVQFSWSPGANEGSDVVEYVLSGAVQGGTGSTATTATVSGPNGEDLCLAVTARNAAGESPSSARVCAKPYGRPIVTVTAVEATGRGEGTLAWAADGNGRPLTGQTVTGCTTTPAAVTATTRTVTLSCGANLNPTITIAATNEAGLRGEATAQPQLYAPPQILTDFRITGRKDVVVVDALPSANSLGRPITHWQARVTGGSWVTLPPDRVVGATAWVSTSLELRACNSETSCSDPRTSQNTAVPYTTPAAATDLVAARQDGQPDNVDLSFSWAAPADPGPWRFTYQIEWGVGATAGSAFDDLGGQRTITLTGVASTAQSGQMQICIRDTGICSIASFEIPAAPP